MTEKKRAVALGFFDGLHTAHRKVIGTVCSAGEKEGLVPTAVTFDVHPSSAIQCAPQQLIDTLDERIKGFYDLGIKDVEILTFSKVRNMSRDEFIDDILIKKLATGFVAVGYDFRFGKDGAGDAEYLKSALSEHEIPCVIVPKMVAEGGEYSSCTIREYIHSGEMEKAEMLLGRHHKITGEVIHGKALGRTIGFPTMNVAFSPDVVLPKEGVYITKTFIDGECFESVTNVSHKGNPLSETYAFDFLGDAYGKTITVEFLHFVRDMCKFDSLEELKTQIEKDKQTAIEYLK